MRDSGQVGSSAAERVSAWLADERVERCVRWREACGDVRAAYENWRDAERADREGAFLAYGAALDREESAAHDYREIVERRGPRVGGPARS